VAFLRRLTRPTFAALDARTDQVDPSLVVDESLGDQASREWARRVSSGDGRSFREYLASETDSERRDFMIETVLAAMDKASTWRASWTDEWVQDEPGSALARMVKARHLVHQAWHARSSEQIKDVSFARFDRFQALLEQSWRVSGEALELDPEEASIYALMIDCGKGLQVGLDTITDLYEDAQSRRPWQQMAHHSMLQALAKKWSGSDEQMFDFARSRSAAAPEGSLVHGLIPVAHVEVWLYVGDRYWSNSRVRDEVLQAAERSIDSPQSSANPWLARVRSDFAFVLWQVGEHERARREFEQLGPVVGGVFRYMPEPLETATIARREVRARGGG
jgi:hypothetical protein